MESEKNPMYQQQGLRACVLNRMKNVYSLQSSTVQAQPTTLTQLYCTAQIKVRAKNLNICYSAAFG